MKWFVLLIAIGMLNSCTEWRKDATRSYAKLPNMKMLFVDSSTVFSTKMIPAGSPVVLFYFSPDCEHCQAETVYLLSNLKKLAGAKLIFVSAASLKDMRVFINSFKVHQDRNLVIGCDYQYEFYNVYKLTSYPFIAIYNKERELVKVYKGEVDLDRITKALKS